jgi:putative membrane protein
MKNKGKLFLMAVTCCAGCLTLQAQMMGHSPAAQSVNNPNQNGMANNGMGVTADASFLKDAAAANLAEISAAQLALSKTSNDGVKQFAQKMIDDHTAMEKDVEADASALDVSLPREPRKSDRIQADKLKALSGAEFDKAYVSAQVKDHKKVLAEMKQENASTQNPQLKDLTTKGSAKVAEHLRMAQELQAKVG